MRRSGAMIFVVSLSAAALVGPARRAAAAAYYRFEGTPGSKATTVTDSAGGTSGTGMPTGNEPVYSTSVPAATVPQTGAADTAALAFSKAASQYVSVPDSPALDFNNQPFTIEAYVKLTTLAGGTGAGSQRQYVAMKKLTNTADSALNYALLAQNADIGATFGKTTGRTGNELGFDFGTGTASQNVVSNLQITDTTNWHHISAAFDPTAQTVRFELDGVADTISNVTTVPTTNTGPLTIGSHFNSSGTHDFSYDGLIDELRISPGVLSMDQLLNAPEPSAVALLALGALGLLRRRTIARPW